MSLINLAFYILDILILIASSVGNILVIVVMRKAQVFGQSSASTLMIAVAVADFITDACAIPFCIFVVKNNSKVEIKTVSKMIFFTERQLRITH